MANISNGTVFRVPRHDNFTVMSNKHLRDPNLSWKARGLLSTMLSFPPDWDYTLGGLAKCARDSIDSTRTGIIELETAGYLQRNRQRKPNGTFGRMEYQVWEDPAQNPIFQAEDIKSNVDTHFHPELENPILDNPTLEKPTLEKPISENPMQLNTQRIKYSSNQSIYPSDEDTTAAERPEKIDGLMEQAAELPKSIAETMQAMGFRRMEYFSMSDDASGSVLIGDAEALDILRNYSLESDELKTCRIPYSFSASKPVMEAALRIITADEYFKTGDAHTDREDPTNGVIAALAAMATTPQAEYCKQRVTANQVIDKLNERIAAEGCLRDWLLEFMQQWKNTLAERRESITHLAAYLKSCLWTWLNDSEAETLSGNTWFWKP